MRVTFTEHFLHVRHCADHFICIITLNSHNSSMTRGSVLKIRKLKFMRLMNLPKKKELSLSGARLIMAASCHFSPYGYRFDVIPITILTGSVFNLKVYLEE